MTRLTRTLATLSLLVGSLMACHDDEDNPDANCQSNFTSYTSPAPGYLTLKGTFYPNETVKLTYSDTNGSTQQKTFTPQEQRTSVTFSGLPSGTHTLVVDYSCQDGVKRGASQEFTVQ